MDFILKWKDIYSGDRDINQRLRDNLHVLSGIHIVHDGVTKSLTKAAQLQQLIRDDFSALPHMNGVELAYFDLFPHLLRPYGNKLHSLDADFYRDLNECTSNQAKIVFLQQRSDQIWWLVIGTAAKEEKSRREEMCIYYTSILPG